MKRALLCGYYGMGNGGDEALLATLLQMLPSTITPIVMSGNPGITQKLHGVEAIDRQNLFALGQELNRSDLFIWGGGSLMQDASSWRSPWYYGSLMVLAKKLGLTTIAWGQGVGPLKHSPSQWITRTALQNSDRISVRDHRSAQLLKQWQLSCLVAPDPVWALESDRSANIWHLPAPRVAVALRPHPQLSDRKLETLSSALSMFQRATGVHYLFVPFHPASDLAIAQLMQTQIPNSTIVDISRPQSLKGLFQGVEMTIGMRFHSLIMGLAEQSRCWAISYDPKVTQLMTELELSGWEVANIPDRADEICSEWLEFFANGESLNPDQIDSLRDRALIHRTLFDQLS